MNKRLIVTVIFFVCVPIFILAQTGSSVKRKKVLLTSDTLAIDSLPIIPNSIKVSTISNETIKPYNNSLYSVDLEKGVIVFKEKISDTLEIIYRTFPPLFS